VTARTAPRSPWLGCNIAKQNASRGFRCARRGAKLDRHVQVKRHPLTSLQIMRRFGPWLLGLFLIAQLAGVVPVMFDHAVHVFESQPAVSGPHDHSAPVTATIDMALPMSRMNAALCIITWWESLPSRCA
jgi:hypothetical protein